MEQAHAPALHILMVTDLIKNNYYLCSKLWTKFNKIYIGALEHNLFLRELGARLFKDILIIKLLVETYQNNVT